MLRIKSTAFGYLCICISLITSQVTAQTNPVVFVHGLLADRGTWEIGADAIASQVSITPYRPTLGSGNLYEVQAGHLRNYLVDQNIQTDVIAVGHSNGGIVSRQLSSFYPLKGILTVNTPHRGAKLSTQVDNIRNIAAGVAFAEGYLWFLMDPWSWADGWIDFAGYDAFISGGIIGTVASITIYDILQTVINNTEVLSEMYPEIYGNPYLQNLNYSSIGNEIQSVPNRFGFVSSAYRYYEGGMFTAIGLDGDAAADMSYWLMGWGLNMIIDGYTLAMMVNYDSPWWPLAWSIIGSVFYLGDLAYFQRDIWCGMVDENSGYGYCLPNDGVVPVINQYYPDANNEIILGPPHVKATKDLVVLSRVAGTLQQITGQ